MFKKKKAKAQTEPQSAAPAHTKPAYLTQTVVFGNGDSSVYFVYLDLHVSEWQMENLYILRYFL